MSARSLHGVRDAANAQPVPDFPTESYVDTLSGQGLRREFLGQCFGGHPISGNIPRSTSIDLLYKRLMDNPRKPQPSEIDLDLRRFIEKCWTHHLCRSGKPKVARYGTGLIWLALMPVGIYRSETGPGGSSVLFR